MIEKNIKKLTAAVFIITFVLMSLLIGPITCSSGWQSPSIGHRGACSHHGGVATWKGFLPILVSVCVSLWFYARFSPKIAQPSVSSINQPTITESYTSSPNTNQTLKEKRPAKNQVGCPKCRSPMRLRIAKKGKNPGHKFWGCSRFPRCKGTKPYIPDNDA